MQFEKGVYAVYDILVNDEKTSLKAQTQEGSWQCVYAGDAKGEASAVFLKEGANTIVIEGKLPHIPNVGYVKLSPAKEKVAISDNHYKAFLDEIQRVSKALGPSGLKTAPDTAVMSNPYYSYTYKYNVSFQYTALEYAFVENANETIKVTTSPGLSGPVEHYVSIFYINDGGDEIKTDGNSIVVRSNASGYADVSYVAKIPGRYYVMLRAVNNGTSGVVNMKINGSIYNNEPVTCSRYEAFQDIGIYNTITYNFRPYEFHIMVFEDDATAPSKVVAYKPAGEPETHWGISMMRCKHKFTSQSKAFILSIYYPCDVSTVTCDLYSGLKQQNQDGPENDDMLITDDSPSRNSYYNCFSWAGGVTSHAFEGSSASGSSITVFNQYYPIQGNGGDNLTVYKNFYGNVDANGCYSPRYCGATTYQFVPHNGVWTGVVDIWGYRGDDMFNYTDSGPAHATITNGSDSNEHGLLWESKNSLNDRLWHSRENTWHANSNGGDLGAYGIIGHFVKIGVATCPVPFPNCQEISANGGQTQNSKADESENLSSLEQGISLDESIARGSSVLESVQFSDYEIKILESLKDKIPYLESLTFERKYQQWKEVRENMSDPRQYRKNTEYREYIDLLDYCKKQGQRIWPLVFEKYNENRPQDLGLLGEVTLSGNDQNMKIAKAIMENNDKNRYTDEGSYIVRSSYTNAMLYVKQLLRELSSLDPIEQKGNDGISYSNSNPFNVRNNAASSEIAVEFRLDKSAAVILSIWDTNGREITSLLNTRRLASGEYQYSWHYSNNYKGVFFVKYLVNGNINIKKIIL